MCGPADDSRAIRPLPNWMTESMVMTRCLPPLGVHERCEHDPDYPPVSFRDLGEVRQ